MRSSVARAASLPFRAQAGRLAQLRVAAEALLHVMSRRRSRARRVHPYDRGEDRLMLALDLGGVSTVARHLERAVLRGCGDEHARSLARGRQPLRRQPRDRLAYHRLADILRR